MTSNEEFLNRYSPLTTAQSEKITASVRVISKASKKVICYPKSDVLHDYGVVGSSRVGSDGVRR